MSEVSETQVGEVDENALVERARQNDYRAYEQLYRLHVGRVFALCFRLCNDRDMAEDLAQESFVLAWRKLSNFRGDAAFGSWLYRIATNTAISYLRKQKPFRHALDIDDVDESEYRETTDEQVGLERAIALLPDGARTVFVLYSLEGYTHDEIAKMLDIAQGSSKAQLHRARKLLMGHLS
ncbi:MAG: sigma-70 family RNA polymerase sigma factor [Pseudomonadales bacterium]|nr:sigma-70 family RNA polymerase sigma factor [Pseudomonadales bacterium]